MTEEQDDFTFVKHNDTDYDGYNAFKKGFEDRYKAVAADRDRHARIVAFTNWIQKIPTRWRDASMKSLDPAQRTAIMDRLKAGERGFYITGDHGRGKTHTAYAIIRRLVTGGRATSSEILTTTELELASLATGGYETRQKLDDLVLNGSRKVYFIDSVGLKNAYDPKREAPAFSALIEKIYDSSAYVIFASHLPFEEYAAMLPDAAAAKLQSMMKGGLVDLGFDEQTESAEETSSASLDPLGWRS